MTILETVLKPPSTRIRSGRPDHWMLAGAVIACAAILIGISSTGVGLGYFLQPTGAVIVLGGTLGVVLVTTPRQALLHSARRVAKSFSAPAASREALIEEVISYARVARQKGILAIEPMIERASNRFLHDSLMLALDVQTRAELEISLDTEIRLKERHGEADAKTLEVAGGFAPTIGILGTVVGLIDVLKEFSKLQLSGYGVGTAFVSTIYGLALANLVLLPLAHRIRARSAENLEMQELIGEGVLCIFDGIHPSLIRQRLGSFLREPAIAEAAPQRQRAIGRANVA